MKKERKKNNNKTRNDEKKWDWSTRLCFSSSFVYFVLTCSSRNRIIIFFFLLFQYQWLFYLFDNYIVLAPYGWREKKTFYYGFRSSASIEPTINKWMQVMKKKMKPTLIGYKKKIFMNFIRKNPMVFFLFWLILKIQFFRRNNFHS